MPEIVVKILKTDNRFTISLIGHSNTAHVTTKRDALNAIGEMMDSKCAEGACNCGKAED